ncbi:hypothetical protein MMC11_006713 [Xylographa trunciseda]|nr:hypothetical protein [Xylographa trunciseda]
MDKFHSNNKVLLPLRGVAVLFAIIELGLTAYGVSAYDFCEIFEGYQYCQTFGSLNFVLFASLWSLLLLAYLFATLRFGRFSHPIASFVLLLVTSLFWFSGFIALAVAIGGSSCGPNRSCQAIAAASAFGAFLWLIFLVDAIFAGMAAFSGSRTSGQTFGQPMQTA